MKGKNTPAGADIKIWIRAKHGKGSKSELVHIGHLPKSAKLGRRLHFMLKAKVRDEYLRTGRFVPTERVVEIATVMRLADALS